jgi:hypothetical protein
VLSAQICANAGRGREAEEARVRNPSILILFSFRSPSLSESRKPSASLRHPRRVSTTRAPPPRPSAPLESKALESVLQQLSINISITFMFLLFPPPSARVSFLHFLLFLLFLVFQVPPDNGGSVSPRAGIKRLTRKITGLSQRLTRDGLLSARFHAVPGHEYVRR